MTERNELAELSAKFRQAAAELTTRDVSQLSQQLADIATQLDAGMYIGTITHLGAVDGAVMVGFVDRSNNNNWSSVWPQWAYELAKIAMLNRNDVMIFTNGPPYGSNLVHVWIFRDPLI